MQRVLGIAVVCLLLSGCGGSRLATQETEVVRETENGVIIKFNGEEVCIENGIEQVPIDLRKRGVTSLGNSVCLGNGTVMLIGRFPGEALLKSGKIKGKNSSFSSPNDDTWLLNTETNTIVSGPRLTVPRRELTAIGLKNGMVLVCGGTSSRDSATAASSFRNLVRDIEIWAPGMTSFAPYGELALGRLNPGVVQINDRQILIVNGGKDADLGLTRDKTIELFDIQTKKSEIIGHTLAARTVPHCKLIAPKKVVVAGYQYNALTLQLKQSAELLSIKD